MALSIELETKGKMNHFHGKLDQVRNNIQHGTLDRYLLTSSQSQLVDKIKRDSPLSDPHLLGLPILPVLPPDLINRFVQSPRGFVLLPVLLAFQLRAGIQHDVFHLILDVLGPGREPRHRGIVPHFFPFVSWRRHGNFRILNRKGRNCFDVFKKLLLRYLAAVDGDVFGVDSFLQHAHFGVLSPAPEQRGGLNLEVPDLLFVPVDDTKAVFFHQLLVLLLNLRLLFLGTISVLFCPVHEIGVHSLEIALFEIRYLRAFFFCHHFPPVLEEIVVERLFCRVIVIQHRGVESRYFFCVLR